MAAETDAIADAGYDAGRQELDKTDWPPTRDDATRIGGAVGGAVAGAACVAYGAAVVAPICTAIGSAITEALVGAVWDAADDLFSNTGSKGILGGYSFARVWHAGNALGRKWSWNDAIAYMGPTACVNPETYERYNYWHIHGVFPGETISVSHPRTELNTTQQRTLTTINHLIVECEKDALARLSSEYAANRITNKGSGKTLLVIGGAGLLLWAISRAL